MKIERAKEKTSEIESEAARCGREKGDDLLADGLRGDVDVGRPGRGWRGLHWCVDLSGVESRRAEAIDRQR